MKAILFDLDNTLIETSRAGGVAMQKVRKSNVPHVAFKANSVHICNVSPAYVFNEGRDHG